MLTLAVAVALLTPRLCLPVLVVCTQQTSPEMRIGMLLPNLQEEPAGDEYGQRVRISEAVWWCMLLA